MQWIWILVRKLSAAVSRPLTGLKFGEKPPWVILCDTMCRCDVSHPLTIVKGSEKSHESVCSFHVHADILLYCSLLLRVPSTLTMVNSNQIAVI